MKSPAIVVVGYNRPEALSRLLMSLSEANFDGASVPLIISIDQNDNAGVAKIADDFRWNYGEKIVNVHPKRLGLRKHIISCGNLALQYGSAIVLEDDLFVSPNFYMFAKAAIAFYEKEDKIAGISLYSHLWNVNCSRPFVPADDGMDAYFLQFAQSWGQVWTASMWRSFIDWYNDNAADIQDEPDLPQTVVHWPDTSWLKYFIKYLVRTNRYFVYPRISLTTNFGDRGQHSKVVSSSYQVPLLLGDKKDYKFPKYDINAVIYDVFFERAELGAALGVLEEELCVDLYSSKGNNLGRRYWLTMTTANYRVHSSYGLRMRPHEVNIIYGIKGDDIYCYDTTCIYDESKNKRLITKSKINRIAYELRDTKRADIWVHGIVHLRKLVASAIKKVCILTRIIDGADFKLKK
ncbi:MAG: hypothetical protein M0024_07260 [Nitrospiraceae bacterium]|nr:hypothetical protein [Nitrospiraceae bacterium]